jgi:hypothetical protein
VLIGKGDAIHHPRGRLLVEDVGREIPVGIIRMQFRANVWVTHEKFEIARSTSILALSSVFP